MEEKTCLRDTGNVKLLEFLKKAATCIKNGEFMQLVGKLFIENEFHNAKLRPDQIKRDLKNKYNLRWNMEVRISRNENMFFFIFEDPEESAKVVMSITYVDGKLLDFKEKIDQVRYTYLNFSKYIFWVIFPFNSLFFDRVYMARKVVAQVGEVLKLIGPHQGKYKALL
ncbi:hypothetical protein MKX01_037011 [Papaver californicum]|nr:hypothetical protein MKX01_037011 [Papaver californicum]